MPEFVGVLPYSTVGLEDLKQQALLFDRIAVPGLDLILDNTEDFESNQRDELCWLKEQGVVFEAEVNVTSEIVEVLRNAEPLLMTEPGFFTRMTAQYLRQAFNVDAIALEGTFPLQSRHYIFLPKADNTYKARAHCLYARPRSFDHHGARGSQLPVHLARANTVFLPKSKVPTPSPEQQQSNVIDIVLKRFPYVGENTAWEKILDFRNDEDARDRRTELRHWMSEMACKSQSPIEIEQQIDYLLSKYENHMRIHKMELTHGVLRTAVVGTATILEDLAKFKWGKLADSLFAVSDRNAALMKAELDVPGREVSYLLCVSREF